MAISDFGSTIPFRKEIMIIIIRIKTRFFEFPLAMLDAPVFWLGRQRVRVTNDATEDAAAAIKLHDVKEKEKRETFLLTQVLEKSGKKG